jgi:RNA polymerase subunit RPABC4/transcription elongation factor Spt4
MVVRKEEAVRCPNCGTLVKDGLDVCPACHAYLGDTLIHTTSDVLWCESCGSAIPSGRDTCPVCGMPVAGAFDEDYEDQEVDGEDASALVSAIPPDPSETPEGLQSIEERPRELRHLLIAATAALLLVGGGALFITRPWDPDAYITHATTDADTSMEGFPGTVTHLPSQDRVEDAVWQAYLGDVDDFLTSFHDRMGEMSREAEVLYGSLPGITPNGDMSVVRDRALVSARLREELVDTSTLAARLVLPDAELDKRRDKLLVLSTYLRGELDILQQAWEAASNEKDLRAAGVAASGAVKQSSEGRSLNEWRDLFRNAYEM